MGWKLLRFGEGGWQPRNLLYYSSPRHTQTSIVYTILLLSTRKPLYVSPRRRGQKLSQIKESACERERERSCGEPTGEAAAVVELCSESCNADGHKRADRKCSASSPCSSCGVVAKEPRGRNSQSASRAILSSSSTESAACLLDIGNLYLCKCS